MFKCPVKKSLRPVQVQDQGKIKRIRGVAWAVRVRPSVVNRMVEVSFIGKKIFGDDCKIFYMF